MSVTVSIFLLVTFLDYNNSKEHNKYPYACENTTRKAIVKSDIIEYRPSTVYRKLYNTSTVELLTESHSTTKNHMLVLER